MTRKILRTTEVSDRLQQLGLTVDILRQAVSAGMVGYLNCTANHPSSFPGMVAWGETVRSIREQLVLLGWDRVNDKNLPLTANQLTSVAITASSGDECTGIEQLSPRTRNPKGTATKNLADANALQLGLFEEMAAIAPEAAVAEANKWQTWLLLTYRDTKARVVRSELSRPIKLGVDGKVERWDERIILPDLPFDSDSAMAKPNDGRNANGALGTAEQSEVIDVPVRRRG